MLRVIVLSVAFLILAGVGGYFYGHAQKKAHHENTPAVPAATASPGLPAKAKSAASGVMSVFRTPSPGLEKMAADERSERRSEKMLQGAVRSLNRRGFQIAGMKAFADEAACLKYLNSTVQPMPDGSELLDMPATVVPVNTEGAGLYKACITNEEKDWAGFIQFSKPEAEESDAAKESPRHGPERFRSRAGGKTGVPQ